ncbi:MAG: DNA-3-methyladenine glycosylase 2 family protein [Gammaproteobacteria bacterium]|nr:MAG: DNA-3-methyladenine glycosylase 2 family protein [Gammaproteobacteria bacterium]
MRRQIRAAERHLARVDPVLAGLIRHHGPCTLMRDPRPHFHTLVWAIINQQLSVKAAQSIEARLQARLGVAQFEPQHFHRVREATLRSCGLTGAKARSIREISRRIRSGALDLQELEHMDDRQAAGLLIQLPGIGQWTADMLLMFSLGRLDVLPLGDLALRKSIRMHYRLPDDADHGMYLDVAESWRPYRTVASWYYWAAVD